MKSNMIRSLVCLFVCGMLLQTQISKANIYSVTNTNDAGAGSLRQAILNANANPGKDTIRFAIAVAGNLFEGSAPNTYAVIQLNTILPTISETIFIDGSSQTDTNPGSISGYLVGLDSTAQAGIPYPDIYIVPSASFSFPSNSIGVGGNGLSIDATNVTIKGLAISGFGNTNTNGGTASCHADIAILRSPSPRTTNSAITNCFFSCDPRGATPTLAQRITKGNGILVAGNNESGTISNNYISHTGTYGLHFNGNVDNLSVGPAGTVGNRNWTVSGNQFINISINATISAITRVSDAITLMHCAHFQLTNNYISDAEQMGVDLGYNSDSNYIANNTITGFVNTTNMAPQAGVRIGLASESDTVYKNVIYNNNGTNFKGGIWLDKTTLTQPGVVSKDNQNHLVKQNHIYNNISSGIVLSNSGTGNCYNNILTMNSTHNNGGLGIDLEYNGTTGPTTVTVNDDGDPDAGTNNVQNFPLIDSVRRLSDTLLGFYGKCPPGATLEFFIGDGGSNKFGGLLLNYGEGKTYIGTGVEGSGSDLAPGTGSYNIDGNVASNNVNLFAFVLTWKGAITNLDSVTSTATLLNNTSEFGPVVTIFGLLDVSLISFSSSYYNNDVRLNWEAICRQNFRYFDIEYSTDGKYFTKIGTVNSKTPEAVSNYEFLHQNPGAGRHFYRLRMVNNDGRMAYSSIVYVNTKDKIVKGLENVNSFFSDRIDLRVQSDKDEDMAVHLFDQAGRLVRYTQVHGKRGVNFIQFDNLSSLSSGTYIVYVKKTDETLSKRVIKQ